MICVFQLKKTLSSLIAAVSSAIHDIASLDLFILAAWLTPRREDVGFL